MYGAVYALPWLSQAKLKGLEKSLAEAKKAFNEATQRLKALEQQAKVLELEMAGLRGENTNMDDQVRNL